MNKIGRIRCLDGLGRICIPREIRKKLMIENGDQVEIYDDGDTVFVRKYEYEKPIKKHIANLGAAIKQEDCCKNRTELLRKLRELEELLDAEPESEAP